MDRNGGMKFLSKTLRLRGNRVRKFAGYARIGGVSRPQSERYQLAARGRFPYRERATNARAERCALSRTRWAERRDGGRSGGRSDVTEGGAVGIKHPRVTLIRTTMIIASR